MYIVYHTEKEKEELEKYLQYFKERIKKYNLKYKFILQKNN